MFLKSGWRAGAALSMGFYAFQLCVHLSRGPHCERFTWVGYQGGIEPRKKVVEERMRRKREEAACDEMEKKADLDGGSSLKFEGNVNEKDCASSNA